jgi:hypothetical protein
MRHRGGSWYSDWRDEHGKRRMKAHRTEAAAKKHQGKMRREAERKKVNAWERLR